MVRIRSSSEILEKIRVERVREQATASPALFHRENSGPAFRIAGAIAFIGGLALLAMFGARPAGERWEAIGRLDTPSKISRGAPYTARELSQNIRQPIIY
jgi:hypothetical protein